MQDFASPRRDARRETGSGRASFVVGRPPVRAAKADRVGGLLRCGLLLLADACPPERDAYLCDGVEEYDEDVCTRCWERYLYAVANGDRVCASMRRN